MKQIALALISVAFILFGITIWTSRSMQPLLLASPPHVVVVNPNPSVGYRIELKASTDIEIVNVVPSCRCTQKISLAKSELKKGESTHLEFELLPPKDLKTSRAGFIAVLFIEKGGNSLLKRLEIPIQ